MGRENQAEVFREWRTGFPDRNAWDHWLSFENEVCLSPQFELVMEIFATGALSNKTAGLTQACCIAFSNIDISWIVLLLYSHLSGLISPCIYALHKDSIFICSCNKIYFSRNNTSSGGDRTDLLLPLFFFVGELTTLFFFFFFAMTVKNPRCQIAAAAGCMADPLGCSWVSTPGLILAVSCRWSADCFSELSCSSNASSFFLSFSHSSSTLEPENSAFEKSLM